MSTPPPVGIGMPVRNGEMYLADALDSLLGQTWTDFELLISDNASEDSTAEICREAARDARVRYVRQQTNIGAAANYNLVFHETRGEYFRWASHDDISAPSHLQRCLDLHASSSADTSLVYPRTLLIDENGEPIGEYEDGMDLFQESTRARLQQFAHNWGLGNPVMGLMRRDIALRTRLIDTFVGSDLVLLAELALHGKVREVPEPLFHRRIHPGSAMQGTTNTDLDVWLDPAAEPRNREGLGSTIPLLREILRSVGRSELSTNERIEVAAGLTASWMTRRARVRGGLLKQSLRERVDLAYRRKQEHPRRPRTPADTDSRPCR